MNSQHLSEQAIQQYAVEPTLCGEENLQHLASCVECRSRANAYLLLLGGIREQEIPAFDFDLAAMVVSRIETVPAMQKRTDPLIYVMIFLAVMAVGAAGFVYGDYLALMFKSVAPLLTFLILTCMITVVAAVAIDMLKGYRRKMRSLDLY